MSNAIGIGIKTPPAVSPMASPGAVPAAKSGFADLIVLADGSAASTPRTTAAGVTSPADGSGALGDTLGQLLETLSALVEKLENRYGLDGADLEHLEELLADVESLLENGVPLPLPQSAVFEKLAALGKSLGLDIKAQAAAPLEMLSSLATQLAGAAREENPDLAARLTGFAKALDIETADIQSAVVAQKAGAIGAQRHIEGQAELNPAASIDAARPEDTPDTPPARSGPERALTVPARDSGAPVQAAAAASASTAPVPAELEAPDGLTLGAPQPQSQTVAGQGTVRPEAALYQRPEAQINLPHIAAEISRHVQNGLSRFEIRLNPAELGRIEVRMEIDASGNVLARLAVERSETLDLLQRDHKSLERALTEAGLDAGKTELEFSLKDGRDGKGEDERDAWRTSALAIAGTETQSTSTIAEQGQYMRGYARLDAVNLWV